MIYCLQHPGKYLAARVVRSLIPVIPMNPRPLPAPDTAAGTGEIPLHDAIALELATIQAGKGPLLEGPDRRHWQVMILFVCLCLNGLYFLVVPDYVTLFVAASFYLNMGYFITLLIPTSPGSSGGSIPEITRFRTWLTENGIRTGTSQFTRIFINAFFMNSRALTLGISLLFTVDILMVIVAFLGGMVPLRTTLVVAGQSAIIILFYLLVWKTEPFTARFEQDLGAVRDRLARDLPPWMISFLFLTGFLLVVLVFLTTIILLPGMTLDAFLTQSGLREIAHRFSLIGLLVISQYFIIRFIHGNTSRAMAERLLLHRELALKELLAALNGDGEKKPVGNLNEPGRFENSQALLESRIYKINRNTLLGMFPVFVVDLDFSVLLDSTTRRVIRGYIRKG